MNRLERLLDDAILLEERMEDFEQNAMQQLSARREDVEAMIPVILGEQPIMITANRQSDIENALALQEEFGLDLILQGAREGWVLADTLASAGFPIVLSAVGNIPTFDGLSARFENPGLLAAGGCQCCARKRPREWDTVQRKKSATRRRQCRLVRNGLG